MISVRMCLVLSFHTTSPITYLICSLVSVLGCPDLKTPENAWLERSSDTTTIGCKHSTQTWQQQCVASHWLGEIGTCKAQG